MARWLPLQCQQLELRPQPSTSTEGRDINSTVQQGGCVFVCVCVHASIWVLICPSIKYKPCKKKKSELAYSTQKRQSQEDAVRLADMPHSALPLQSFYTSSWQSELHLTQTLTCPFKIKITMPISLSSTL